MSAKQITIVKVGETEAPAPAPKSAGVHKATKTFPRGILKTAKTRLRLRPSADPAKPPPLKKNMKRHTIRITTDRGARRHRSTIRHRVAKMSDAAVRTAVVKSGILKNPSTPVAVMREMLEGGMLAGFISDT